MRMETMDSRMYSSASRVTAVVALLSGAVASPALASDVGDSSYDWTGFYLGAFAAGGIGTTDAAYGTMHPIGVFGGVDVGLQYQFDPVVIGLEVNASLSDLDDDKGTRGINFQTQDMDNIGSVRAKLGMPVGERMMVFGTAGWSWGKSEYGEISAQEKKDIYGPSLGVGAHYALSDHFISRAEYVHYFYGDTTYSLATPTTVSNSADELRIGLDYKF